MILVHFLRFSCSLTVVHSFSNFIYVQSVVRLSSPYFFSMIYTELLCIMYCIVICRLCTGQCMYNGIKEIHCCLTKTCERFSALYFRTTPAEGRHDFPQLAATTRSRATSIVDSAASCGLKETMSSSFGRRALAHSRSFLSLKNVARKPSFQALRRGMASDAHGAKSSSDMPWLLGSGLVTAAGAAYLLTPPSKKAAHTAATAGHPLENKHQPASSEGGAIRGERFTGETKKALGGGDDKPEKEAEPMKDDEGEEASGKEVGASMQQAEDADAPKDAKASEEDTATDSSKEDKPSESSSESEDSAPQSQQDVPNLSRDKEKKTGTVTDKEGPTPMGDARKAATEKNAPKEASK